MFDHIADVRFLGKNGSKKQTQTFDTVDYHEYLEPCIKPEAVLVLIVYEGCVESMLVHAIG